jgi:hypothetical protein
MAVTNRTIPQADHLAKGQDPATRIWRQGTAPQHIVGCWFGLRVAVGAATPTAATMDSAVDIHSKPVSQRPLSFLLWADSASVVSAASSPCSIGVPPSPICRGRADQSTVVFLSMDLSMNSRPRVPVEASSHEVVHASAHVAYSCGVNSKSHNPSGRGFDSHPPHRLSSGDAPLEITTKSVGEMYTRGGVPSAKGSGVVTAEARPEVVAGTPPRLPGEPKRRNGPLSGGRWAQATHLSGVPNYLTPTVSTPKQPCTQEGPWSG